MQLLQRKARSRPEELPGKQAKSPSESQVRKQYGDGEPIGELQPEPANTERSDYRAKHESDSQGDAIKGASPSSSGTEDDCVEDPEGSSVPEVVCPSRDVGEQRRACGEPVQQQHAHEARKIAWHEIKMEPKQAHDFERNRGQGSRSGPEQYGARQIRPGSAEQDNQHGKSHNGRQQKTNCQDVQRAIAGLCCWKNVGSNRRQEDNKDQLKYSFHIDLKGDEGTRNAVRVPSCLGLAGHHVDQGVEFLVQHLGGLIDLRVVELRQQL